METRVVVPVRRLVAEQIPVRARVEICLIARAALFPDGEGDRAGGETLADLGDDTADPLVREVRILAALQDERAVPEGKALRAAGQNLLLAQPITRGVRVVPPDAAEQLFLQ